MASTPTRQFRRAFWPGLACLGAAALITAPLFLNTSVAAAADAPVGLGTAGGFSVLAGSTVTNTGPSTLEQDLGVHPGTTAPGFPPGEVEGETHLADAVALQAKDDLTTAYDDAAGRTPFTNLAAELGGTTLDAGVYRIAAAQLTGQLTLDGEGDPAAVFIFQIDSTLITGTDSSVVFINGAAPCNVFWQVGSSATLGTGTDFIGTIMAMASITMNTGANLQGRALARTAAVTLDNNQITDDTCEPTPTPTGDDTGTDTGTEVGTDTGTETGTDTGTDTGTETGTDTGTETGTDTGTETGTDTGTETGTDTGTETGTDTGTETGTDTGTETGTDTGTETPTPTETPTETPTPSESPTGTETGADTGDSGTETGGPGELPDTGSGSTPVLAAAGIALIALAAGFVFFNERRTAGH